MVKNILIVLVFFQTYNCYSQDSTHIIKVHFLYGSVPAKKYKNEEKKWFGGLHGGHVTLEVNQQVYGFNPKGRYHVFPQRKNKHGAWSKESSPLFYKDTVGNRYASFVIPVSTDQKQKLDSLLQAWYINSPRDYSFFGFRCASSTWEALEEIGILQSHSDLWKAWVIFYPRRIRKRMYRFAEQENWNIEYNQGRATRKWEKDLKRKGFK